MQLNDRFLKWLTGFGSPTRTNNSFVPSNLENVLSMDDTAKTTALDDDTKKILIDNEGATTEAIRVSFGTSVVEAEDGLTIVAGAATTGFKIHAEIDKPTHSMKIFGRPEGAKFYSISNTVSGHTQDVNVYQGK